MIKLMHRIAAMLAFILAISMSMVAHIATTAGMPYTTEIWALAITVWVLFLLAVLLAIAEAIYHRHNHKDKFPRNGYPE